MELFIDTGYWLALYNARDRLHVRARALASSSHGPFVTTDAILLEVGNSLSSLRQRTFCFGLLQRIRTDTNITVVQLTPELLSQAIELFGARVDKEWGLVDCISFVVMRERGITEALATDQHFMQAGFRPLLRA